MCLASSRLLLGPIPFQSAQRKKPALSTTALPWSNEQMSGLQIIVLQTTLRGGKMASCPRRIESTKISAFRILDIISPENTSATNDVMMLAGH